MLRTALPALLLASASAAAEGLSLADLPRLLDGRPYAGTLAAGAAPFAFEVTGKGNGVLRAGGLAFKVYDVNDEDGARFAPALLAVAEVDLDGRGAPGLLVSGAEVAASGEVRPIACLYRWDGARLVAVSERNAAAVRLPD